MSVRDRVLQLQGMAEHAGSYSVLQDLNCSGSFNNVSSLMIPDCVSNYNKAVNLSSCCNSTWGADNCSQFCNKFRHLPQLYLGVSVLSALCCLLVFLTYLCLPRLRQTGYSSKVFLNR